MEEKYTQTILETLAGNYIKDMNVAVKATLKLADAGSLAAKKIDFKASIEDVNELGEKFDGAMDLFEKLVIKKAGKQFLNMGKKVFSEYISYESQMEKLTSSISNQSEQVKSNLRADIKEVAWELHQLPENVIDAAYIGLSNSVDPAEIGDILNLSVKTAIAGGITNDSAMDGLTSIVNAYGKEDISYEEVSNQLLKSKNLGQDDMDNLIDNIMSILPEMGDNRLPLDNILSALLTMSEGGSMEDATDQIVKLISELGVNDSKIGDYLQQVTGKTFKELISDGYNLQDVLFILRENSKKLGVDFNDLFETSDAGSAALEITGRSAKVFSDNLNSLKNSVGETERVYGEMSGTLSSLLDGVIGKVKIFKEVVWEKISKDVIDAFDRLNGSLDRAAENGSLDRLAESISGIITGIIGQLDFWINNIDEVIIAIGFLANFVQNRLPEIIEIVKRFVEAWAIFKVAGTVSAVVEEVAGTLELLQDSISGASNAMGIFNAILNANPVFLVVTAIGILIVIFVEFAKKLGGFHNLMIFIVESIKKAVLSYLKLHIWIINKILSSLAILTKFIPGVGGAFRKMADKSKDALSDIDKSIDDSIDKIKDLRTEASEDININSILTEDTDGEINTGKSNKAVGKRQAPGGGMIEIDRAAEVENSYKNNTYEDKNKDEKASVDHNRNLGINTGHTTKKEITIKDKIGDIESKYSSDTDLYSSRVELAEVRKKDNEVKANKRSLIEIFKSQINDLDILGNKSSDDDKKIVEVAKNKLLVKIENTLEEIKGNVKDLIGNFNLPSELKTMTEYQYKVNTADNALTKRLIFSPNVKMYLTLDNLENKGVDQVRREVSNFTNAIFDDKNDLVKKFIDDVTRN